MKILHYVGVFSLPSETFIYDFIKNLEGNKFSCYILAHTRELENERPFPKVKIISEKTSFFKKIYCKLFKNWKIRNEKEVIKHLKQLKPDLIHAHFGPNGTKIFDLVNKYKLDIPVIVSFHGTDTTMFPLKYKKYRGMVKKLTKKDDVIFTFPSNFLKKEFCKNFEVGYSENQVVLVNSFSQSFNRVKETYRQKNGKLKIISIGRLINCKGFKYLIKAVAILEDRFKNVELKIIGDGPEKYNLQALIIENNLQGKVVLTGLVYHNEIQGLLCESDIYVQPSIVDSNTNQTESFGVAVVEAIISGLPVVVTNVGGLPDTVLGGDKKFAKLIKPMSSEQIANAISKADDDCVDNSEFRERIIDCYSRKKQFEDISKIYASLMEKNMLEKFKNFYQKFNFDSKFYWEERYKGGGNSGTGSYGAKSEYKASILNNLLEKNKINNLIEFGCGDGNNINCYNVEYYTGLDVSETAINICISTYKDDEKKSFIYYDPKLFKSGGLKASLTISFEVIFHLIEDDVFRSYLHNLFNTSSKYVLIFSSNDDVLKDSASHVKHRKFTDNVPNNFKLVDEIITPESEELKGLFSNFFLFEKVK